MQFDRKKLFTLLVQRFGTLDGVQQSVVAAIIDEFARRKLTDMRWLAYMLATGWGECKWRPVREIGRGKGKPYGKTDPATGKAYYGRGIVQLTWKRNYQMMGETLNLPLVKDPDIALQVPVAVAILFEGMTTGKRAQDSFTKWQLHDFFSDKVNDPVNARRIINGKDKAEIFARWHYKILEVLEATRIAEASPAEKPSPVEAPASVETEVRDGTAGGAAAGTGGAIIVTGGAAVAAGYDWKLVAMVAGCIAALAVIGWLIFKLRKQP
jgi:hypothetical protein